ncbi:hypothetical protein FACS1894162_3100 [Bacteroidia bacterium]|nr:hypothetical protein FACS1894162_3100 [Bacteroidia bacterium]
MLKERILNKVCLSTICLLASVGIPAFAQFASVASVSPNRYPPPSQNATLTQSKASSLQHFGSKVFFFQTDKTTLLRDYRSNWEAFDALDALLAIPDIYNQVDAFVITAAASPIGNVAKNEVLSVRRAEAMQDYLLWKRPDFPRERIRIAATIIDWEGFWKLVEADKNLPSRDKILQWQYYGALGSIGLVQQLRTLDKPAFDYLKENVYPRLQYASVRLVMKEAVRSVHDTVRVEKVKEIVKIKTVRKSPVIALGSNLLYDGVVVPNLFVEAVVAPQWSVLLQGAWMWWDTREPNYLSYRVQGLWTEGRYWFNRLTLEGGNPLPLSGWYIGAYGSYFNYDFRLFKTNATDYGSLSRNSYSFGLTGGYSKYLNRSLRLDFSLGLGYATGRYYRYNYSHYSEKYIQRQVKQLNYAGPTQLGVSLVWLISGKEERE